MEIGNDMSVDVPVAPAKPLPGDFSFLSQNVESLHNILYALVTKTGNWDNLKKFIPGFGGLLSCKKPDWYASMDSKFVYTGSGSVAVLVMRDIMFIARYGWDDFVLYNSKDTDAVTLNRIRIAQLPYALAEAHNDLAGWENYYEKAPDAEAKRFLQESILKAHNTISNLECELRDLRF